MTIANVDMAKAWDGEEGDHWTEFADRYDAVGVGHWKRFLDAGLVATGDRVLDIGCGTGESTIDSSRIAATALGMDLSSRMLGLARERAKAAGVANVDFVQGDAQVHPFEAGSGDVAISRFGAMFFGDPVAAFANIARATRPGGRLALLSWQGLSANEWLVVFREALAAGRTLPEPPMGGPGPFGLADPDGVRKVLTDAGYRDVELTPSEVPMIFGRDPEDAWSFVQHQGIVKGLSHGLDDAAKAAAHDRLRSELAAHASPDGVQFGSAAWLITARTA
jgi:SAM-dependent methyltransferase